MNNKKSAQEAERKGYLIIFALRTCYIAQVGLKLLSSSNHPASVSQVHFRNSLNFFEEVLPIPTK
jgi:hypothetical protein